MEEYINNMFETLEEYVDDHTRFYCSFALYDKSNMHFKRKFYELCIRHEYIHLLNYIPINDINMPLNNNGNTCLFYVKNKTMFKYLLRRGANIHHKNQRGETFIYKTFLQFINIKDCVWLLEQVRLHNVDILSCNSYGRYFIHQIVKNTIYVQEMRCLIALGIDINVKDKEGKIAIDLLSGCLRNTVVFILAGSIWINKIPEKLLHIESIKIIFECVDKILQCDAEDIIEGKYDTIIENKLKIRDDNLVDFGVEGTNFFTLPYHHYTDALHMLLYGNYSVSHPLHKETSVQGLFRSTKDEDKKTIQGYFENLSLHLKYFQEFVARHDLGLKTALVDCESAAKKIKKN